MIIERLLCAVSIRGSVRSVQSTLRKGLEPRFRMVSEHTSCAVGAPPSALLERDQKQAAQYRCQICRNDSHTTEEHRHPKLSVSRRTELLRVPDRCSVRCCSIHCGTFVDNPQCRSPGWRCCRRRDWVASLDHGRASPFPKGSPIDELP